jgi:hypothetical protein
MFSMIAPNDFRAARRQPRTANKGGWLIGGTGQGNSNSLPDAATANQDRVRETMVKALRRWLEAHGLPAIIIGVLGAVIVVGAAGGPRLLSGDSVPLGSDVLCGQ